MKQAAYYGGWIAFGCWCATVLSAVSILRPMLVSSVVEADRPGWGIGVLVVLLISTLAMTIVAAVTYYECSEQERKPSWKESQ